jgi:hypothetical protein
MGKKKPSVTGVAVKPVVKKKTPAKVTVKMSEPVKKAVVPKTNKDKSKVPELKDESDKIFEGQPTILSPKLNHGTHSMINSPQRSKTKLVEDIKRSLSPEIHQRRFQNRNFDPLLI